MQTQRNVSQIRQQPRSSNNLNLNNRNPNSNQSSHLLSASFAPHQPPDNLLQYIAYLQPMVARLASAASAAPPLANKVKSGPLDICSKVHPFAELQGFVPAVQAPPASFFPSHPLQYMMPIPSNTSNSVPFLSYDWINYTSYAAVEPEPADERMVAAWQEPVKKHPVLHSSAAAAAAAASVPSSTPTTTATTDLSITEPLEPSVRDSIHRYLHRRSDSRPLVAVSPSVRRFCQVVQQGEPSSVTVEPRKKMPRIHKNNSLLPTLECDHHGDDDSNMEEAMSKHVEADIARILADCELHLEDPQRQQRRYPLEQQPQQLRYQQQHPQQQHRHRSLHSSMDAGAQWLEPDATSSWAEIIAAKNDHQLRRSNQDRQHT